MSKLSKHIGQLFITGFPGKEPPSPLLNFLTEEQIGGVILFEENATSPSLAQQNISRIRSCYTDAPPFVAIDQEGGRVSRLREAPAQFRAPAEYGVDRDVSRFAEDYSRSLVYLSSLGINLNLAPVADIALNDENTCLADRCFGKDPGTVSVFVKASVATARTHGVLCCLKHFPGFGAAGQDPHAEVATAEYDVGLWQNRESIPFQDGIANGADLIMTTHLLLPKIDDTIVTGSKKIINDMIRVMLSFDGPVITDDLTMAGAEVLGSVGERAVAAFKAGHDLLLFGRDYEAAMRAYDYFVDAHTRGEISDNEIRASLNRVRGIKYKLTRSVLQ